MSRLCEMASCDRRDAIARSACGIVYVCPPCWAQVEYLSAHHPPRDGMADMPKSGATYLGEGL